MDVFYLICQDWWVVPSAQMWIEILAQIGAFSQQSELLNDTELKDTFEFFDRASGLLGFGDEFREVYSSL